jgi:hypothetical protein
MKKLQLIYAGKYLFCRKKTFLAMKLTMFILLISLFQVSASVYSQTQRLSLKLENVSIKEVLNKIEENTELKFLYRDRAIENKVVSINAKNQTVEEILENVLGSTGNSFKVLETTPGRYWFGRNPPARQGGKRESYGGRRRAYSRGYHSGERHFERRYLGYGW